MANTCQSVFFSAGRSPSVEKLMQAFSLDKETAEKVKGVLTGKVDLMTVEQARRRQEQAYHSHDAYVLALEAVDELIGGYGVEYVAHVEDSFRDAYGFYYINFGDTYDTTLLVSAHGQNWVIGSWGDRVEANPGKYE